MAYWTCKWNENVYVAGHNHSVWERNSITINGHVVDCVLAVWNGVDSDGGTVKNVVSFENRVAC